MQWVKMSVQVVCGVGLFAGYRVLTITMPRFSPAMCVPVKTGVCHLDFGS